MQTIRMKHTLLFIITAFFISPAGLLAQKAISEATISYGISIQNTVDKSPPTNASLVVYLKGTLSRSDMASNLGSEKTIFDSKTGAAVILKEYSGQKLMITLTEANWKEKNKKSEGVIFTDQNEKKTILNYSCTKAVGTLKDGSSITVYYAKDLAVQNKEYDALFRNVPGLPMQYEVRNGSFSFTYTINKLDLNNLPQATFDIPKSGYRIITYEENKLGNKAK